MRLITTKFKKIKKSDARFKSEEGSTLVETLVAMAILVSVLLPTSLFLGYLAYNPQNKEQIKALGLAHSEMETALAAQDYQQKSRDIRGQWRVERKISTQGRAVQIKVTVRRLPQQNILITLTTERLLYEETTEE